jgi:hypothetical protein
MRVARHLVSIMFLLFTVTPAALCQEVAEGTSGQTGTALHVDEMVFCAGIKDREPVGAAQAFPADVFSVCCYTKIAGAQDTTAVIHNWYFGEEKIASVELAVKSSSWRTWSSKKMMPAWRGPWKVEVTALDGTVIDTKGFRLE